MVAQNATMVVACVCSVQKDGAEDPQRNEWLAENALPFERQSRRMLITSIGLDAAAAKMSQLAIATHKKLRLTCNGGSRRVAVNGVG
jgi:hypothetical protein